MSAAGWLWARHQLRRHGASVVVLALLTSLAGGVAMAAAIGARRSRVVVSEALHERRQPDVMSLPSRAAFDWSEIVVLPYVESYGLFAVSQMCIEESGGLRGDQPLCGQPPVEGGWYDSIWRLDVVDGRMATASDEVVINRHAFKQFGYGVGSRLHLATVGAGQLDNFWSGVPEGPERWGPTFAVTVVGIFDGGDDAWRLTTGGAGGPGMAFAPSFMAANGQLLDYRVDAFLRLRGGEADVPRLRADTARLVDESIPVRNLHDARRRVERSTLVEATALWLFAGAVIAAGAVLIGQGIVRLVRATGADAPTLRALGMGTYGLVGACALPGFVVAVLAAGGAAAVALVASARVPIGLARSFDRHPGTKFDVAVMALGAIAITVVVAATAAATAWLSIRGLRARRAWTPSRVGRAVGRLGLPVPMEVGARLALERRCGGAGVVPVRPALVGATVGVLAVIAAATVGQGVGDAVANKDRTGQTWDFALTPDTDDAFVASDPDITAAASVLRGQVSLAGVPVPTYSYLAVGDPLDRVVLSGRLPQSASEIALGPSTADTLHAAIGDVVLAGPGEHRRLVVVGTALTPEVGGHSSYDEGAWVTATGLERLQPPIDWAHYLVDVRAGADTAALEQRLLAAGGRVDGTRFQASVAVGNLKTTRGLPAILGGFLALLGVGALGHTLVLAVHRRRRDLAVLRALGLSRRQTRAVVAWQATTLSAVGVVAGIPLGMLAGRWGWRWVAATMPLDYVTPFALLAIVAAPPVTLMAANAIARVPERAAAAVRPAVALRVE